LPTKLIAAFRATLEEVSDADLLLEVVDSSHEMPSNKAKLCMRSSKDWMSARNARDALNKIDLLDDPSELDIDLYQNAVPISALQQRGSMNCVRRSAMCWPTAWKQYR